MARRTIFICEDYPVSRVIACCPLAIRILERHLGKEILKRDDLDRISLKAAVTLYNKQMHPLLIELNRVCI
jgi:hypothetical protein